MTYTFLWEICHENHCIVFAVFLSTGVSSVYSYDNDHFSYFTIPTDNSFDLMINFAQINDSGNVAFINNLTFINETIWQWNNNNLYHSFYASDITSLFFNDNNDIAWKTISTFYGTSKIFLNGAQLNITNLSDLNNSQKIVYTDYRTPYDRDIYLWDGTNSTPLNLTGGYAPQINDSDEIAYIQPYQNSIYVWDGVSSHKITTTTTSDPSILYFAFNNLSQCIYMNSNNELYLCSDTGEQLIASNLESDFFGFALNDAGDIVWTGDDGNDSEIFLYSNGVVTQVTNNDYDDYHPDINNNGDIVYTENGKSIIIATPVPEPSVVLLFVLGVGILKINRKR